MKHAVRFLSVFLFPLLVVLTTPQASQAADWPPIAPEDLQMNSLKEQPGAPAVILDSEEIDDDMNNFESVYKRIKILTDAGREWANVELPYHRHFTITDISGRTVHADGSIVNFEGKPFDKTVEKGAGVRVKVKSFTLPDVQVGSIIDVRYSLRYDDHSVLAPEWIVQEDIFQRRAYFKYIPFQNHGSTYIELAHNQIANGVAWTPFLGKDSPQPQLHQLPTNSLSSSKTISSWVDLTMKDVPAMVHEPFMPPLNMMRMRVYFYYQENLKTEDYWKSEGKFWNKDVEEFIGKKGGIDEAVAKLVTPSDTPEQKVRKIYGFVSQLENQDYVPERTAAENKVLELKPNKGAEDVLQHRSGNHDELNRLFVSMVRAAGIPASMIWVSDRSEDAFVKQYLSTRQLQAEIAIAQIDGKDVFLDPGTKFCPYGILEWRYSASAGLRQSPKGAEFAQTPPPDYKQTVTTRMARTSLDEHGVLSGTISLLFKGSTAMRLRQDGGRTDAEGRKKLMEDEAKDILPGNSEVSLTNSPDWNNAETPLIAQFHISCPFAVAAGKRLMLQQHLFQVNEKPRFPATQRVNGVYFHLPWQEADEVHITIPAGMEIENLPPDDTVKLSYALYQVHQKQEAPNQFFSRRDFIMGDGVFTTDQYKELKGFFDKVKADDDQPALVRLSANVATTK